MSIVLEEEKVEQVNDNEEDRILHVIDPYRGKALSHLIPGSTGQLWSLCGIELYREKGLVTSHSDIECVVCADIVTSRGLL